MGISGDLLPPRTSLCDAVYHEGLETAVAIAVHNASSLPPGPLQNERQELANRQGFEILTGSVPRKFPAFLAG